MTREDADKIRDNLLNESAEKVEKAYQKAKEDGRVGIYLGRDIPEIEAIHKEYINKLRELYSKVDE